MELRAALEHVEGLEPSEADAVAAVGWAAAPDLSLDEADLAGPIRRSLLLLAAGGDPHRELEPGSRAVRALGDELAELVPAAVLEGALASVAEQVRGLPRLEAAAVALVADPVAARRALALALLASELAGDADPPG